MSEGKNENRAEGKMSETITEILRKYVFYQFT